jgi:signal transduction histidine kinase/ActR/RegA family two-component response regulator
MTDVSKTPVWQRYGPHSIPAKLAVLFAVVIGAISSFFFWFVPAQLEDQARTALEGKALSIGEMAAYSVRSAVVFEDREGMKDALDGAAENRDVLYVAVATPDRQVRAYRQASDAMRGDAHPGQASDPNGVYRVRIPVEWENDTIAYVSIGMRTSDLDAQVARARQAAALVSALVFLIGMLTVLMGSRLVTRPLHDMVGTAQRIAEGDLSERADVTSRDEVGRLAAAFNQMIGRVQAAHQKLEHANRDLEERVERRTRQLVKSEQLLRQAQKMEAVGRLAAGVAHDFNNLLTVINGHTELALMELEGDDPVRESLDRIATAGGSAASLTQQLLAFSRKQVLQPIDLPINEGVENLVKILQGLLGETVALTLDLGADAGTVRADPGQLQQVVMNLAVNAKDAMPDGGQLTIRTRNRSVAAGSELQSEGLQPGGYVELQVADTGIGMPDDVQVMAFEPFFSTKAAGKGTGLGLSTVYGIVSQSGGHLRLESEVGVGTTFSIYFPRIESAREARAGMGVRALDGGSERILLVEDADEVRRLARHMLEREGYSITEADCGEAALGRLVEAGGAFDLLLTDVVMPRMNGRQLAQRVVELYPTMSIMYMSGYTDDEVILSGVRDHAVTFLEKPFTRDALLRSVRVAMNARGVAV